MKSSTRWNIGITAGVVIVAAGIIGLAAARPWQPGAIPGSPADVVEPDSRVLDDAGDDAPVLVEFLDFECEACGALYPEVERLRTDYAGEITYVQRYFPIPSHANSMNAAVAVEAAGMQGEYEAMYHLMFTTQIEWGERQESQAPLFRSYAEQIGLDMDAFDAAVADPATEQRVQADLDAGLALGVEGTPTFFLDGEMLELTSVDDLRAAIDDALAP